MLSPILIVTYPMLIEKLYVLDFTLFKPATFSEICQYAIDGDWENFAFYLTMNENRFVTPVMFQIALERREQDEYWDINRRDYLWYTLLISLIKMLIYWTIAPFLILLIPLVPYFLINIYSFMYWLLLFSYMVPDFSLEISQVIDLYQFQDWSNLLIMRADELCPDGFIVMSDGHCGCQSYQKLEDKQCVELCPKEKAYNRYDSAVYFILPQCLDV